MKSVSYSIGAFCVWNFYCFEFFAQLFDFAFAWFLLLNANDYWHFIFGGLLREIGACRFGFILLLYDRFGL